VGKRDRALLEQLLERVARRVEGKPVLISDRLPSYEEAILEVFGEVSPYRGRGRPPTVKRAPPALCYGQVVKHREGGGWWRSVSGSSSAKKSRGGKP
jgi:hypothetical protein